MISATYRLQLHPKFGFAAAKDLVPYLDALGISHVYASPYFMAQPGSAHGYDLVDPKRLDPELGTEQEYLEWTEALAARGMGHVVDFVPNHMAASTRNEWWRDVLENGQASIYADHFDIEWNPPKEALRGKVLLPVLGGQYGEVLERGELALERQGGSFCVRYFDHCFPVSPPSIAPLLERAVQRLGLPEHDPRRQDLESIANGLARLAAAEPKERAREKEVLKRRLAALVEDSAVARAIDDEVARVNGTPGDPRSFDDLDRLLVEQNYRLAYWRVATEEINYRRFFEINELAAIRMECDAVFDDMHELLLRLVAEGRVHGVRLDHVDGLYDPAGYFEKLRRALDRARGGADGNEIWIIAEKILSPGEALPSSWAVDGTTGYDFLAAVNGLFVDPRAEEPFTSLFRRSTGDARTFGEHAFEAKRTMLRASMASELQMLALRLERIAMRDRRSRDFTLATLRRALGETIAAFPVYRTYVRPDGSHEPRDAQIVTRAIRVARRKNPEVSPSVFAFLRDQLLFQPGAAEDVVAMAMRFQQLTGPVVAKGVEDTAFYTYVRFVALNEVGCMPDRFGTSIASFHAMNAEHLARWPRTMTTTSTHDTKRGEDVRARLAVLAEMPEALAAWVDEWRRIAARYTTCLDEETPESCAPSANDELLFYQTVLGAYPLAQAPDETFVRRITQYMIKAAREAKQHTSWLSPDEAYEAGLRSFVEGMLSDEVFLSSLAAKANAIATYGASNGLAQVLLKIASPGVPDTYQGSETWDLRLVDPDNRAPVDHAGLARALASLERADVRELLASFRDGRIKLYVVSRALRLRRKLPEVFLDGAYRPIDAGEEIVAFVREHPAGTVACAVTRFPYRVTGGRAPWACGDVWGTADDPRRFVALPPGRWRDVFAPRKLVAGPAGIAARDLFRDLPVALLVRE